MNWTSDLIKAIEQEAEEAGIEIYSFSVEGTSFRPVLVVNFSGDQNTMQRILNKHDEKRAYAVP